MANMAATANQSAADQTYDFIIIGGGTAGCVLANRLSARSTSRVLVVEAGRDVAPGSEPADVMSTVPYSYYNPDYRWPDLKTYRGKRGSSSQIAITQARLLGGGSSVMGMIALRGTPADYAEWEAAGAAGWGWDDVLPYYKMLENDRDFDGDLHGKSGPVSIMRDDPSDYPPMTKAALDYARHSQVHVVDDFNGDFRDGLGTLPISRTKTRRAGSTACYLDASVRARANLTVLTDATVRQIHFDGTRAVGVSVAAGARTSREGLNKSTDSALKTLNRAEGSNR